MTGISDFNHPVFNFAAWLLREFGYEVVNPAEFPPGLTWAEYMSMGLIEMVKCDVVVLLPGWTASVGANIERDEAIKNHITISGMSGLLRGRKP